MDKAIKMLTDIKNASSVFGIRPDEIEEALAELQATQAKLDSLGEYCSVHTEYRVIVPPTFAETKAYQVGLSKGKQEMCEIFLTKLDEGKTQ